MQLKNMTIALFYEHPDAGTWSLFDLARHRGVIAPDDLSPDAFFDAAGSIRLYCDRFKCVLQTGAAGELRNYIYFLIESLISLTRRDLTLEFPEASAGTSFLGTANVIAALFQENQTRIVLQDASTDVSISYLDQEGNAPEHRLSPYFRDVTVENRMWKTAAIEALDEYFSVAKERPQSVDQDKLHDLAARWHQHRPAFDE